MEECGTLWLTLLGLNQSWQYKFLLGGLTLRKLIAFMCHARLSDFGEHGY
jgi:hypothetical protein